MLCFDADMLFKGEMQQPRFFKYLVRRQNRIVTFSRYYNEK